MIVLHFSMRIEDIIEHTKAKCNVTILMMKLLKERK